jgi:hypothetical protein
MSNGDAQRSDERPVVTFKEFLETIAPSTEAIVTDLTRRDQGFEALRIVTPKIELHCETCEGKRIFIIRDNSILRAPAPSFTDHFFTYICRNCQKSYKTYSVKIFIPPDARNGTAEKYGEMPAFGPPMPSRFMTLIRAEREIFAKGRRAENQGMGIAAFAYYRRVVDSQKDKLFDEIIRLVKRIGGYDALASQLEEAKAERQFTSAVDKIKQGVPEVLRIDGHNPLTLLYGALSEGLHNHTDAECLQLATHIRIVLSELVERIGIALNDSAELSAAVAKLASGMKPS